MLTAFVKAARLRTLPLAIGSIAMGSVLSAFFDSHSWPITILALTTAILLQILSNFANDYGDFTKGTDDASRTDRALASGQLSVAHIKMALIITAILSLASGIGLLLVSFENLSWPFLTFLVVGLISIAAAIKYTAGKNAYGYKSWGDLAVFLFFGWVAVSGMFYLQNPDISRDFWLSLLPASALGLLGVAVLNINNIRDIEGDSANGKITLAVRLGKKGAEVYQLSLYLSAFALFFLFLFQSSAHNGVLLSLLIPPYLLHWYVLRSTKNSRENRPTFNKLLKLNVLLNLIVVLVVSFILL